MERKIGLFSWRAFAKASSPHANQSTGLSACWRRYGDFSRASRLSIDHPTVLSSTFYFLLSTSFDDLGHGASGFPSRRNYARRVPLLLGRACRRIRLHRGHDLVRVERHLHSADRARPQHSRGRDRFVSILAGRIFFLAAFLAVRAALDPRGLFRRLPSGAGRDPENRDRRGAALFGGAIIFPARRSAGRDGTRDAGCDCDWNRNWFSFGRDGDGRRNFSHAAAVILSLGNHPRRGGCFRIVYFGELDCGTCRIYFEWTASSEFRLDPRRGRGDGRNARLISRQPTFSRPHHLNHSSDGARARGLEIELM